MQPGALEDPVDGVPRPADGHTDQVEVGGGGRLNGRPVVVVVAFGLAPSDYQRQLRLREARGLLGTGLPSAQVATDVGFADQAHLTRWFHRCYGVTPGAYRPAAC